MSEMSQLDLDRLDQFVSKLEGGRAETTKVSIRVLRSLIDLARRGRLPALDAALDGVEAGLELVKEGKA